MRDSLFSDRERFVIIGEIGRMQGLSFGEGLELLDRLLGGAIISPGGRSEPVDPGHLGCLIRQVSIREEIDHQERRVLMCKLAIAGLDATPPKRDRSILERGYQALRGWIGQSWAPSVRRTGEPSLSDGEFEEVERLVKNVAGYFTSTMDERDPRSPYRAPDLIRDPGRDPVLNRALPGDDDLSGMSNRPRRRKKKPIHDEDESDTLDLRFSNWFWGGGKDDIDYCP